MTKKKHDQNKKTSRIQREMKAKVQIKRSTGKKKKSTEAISIVE